MKEHVRAAVAGIALCQAHGRKVSAIYDYSIRRYRTIEVSITNGQVSGYDYDIRCHVDGTIPNLYHYGEKKHIDFKSKDGGKFEGYDYGSNRHFEVTVRGNNADVYDYGESRYFSYSI